VRRAGLAIGVPRRTNHIGWSPDLRRGEQVHDGEQPGDRSVTGDTVKIATGVSAGNVYKYMAARR
jgi:hypothetical protein